MDTRNVCFRAALSAVAAFACGLGLAVLPGCDPASDGPAQGKATQGVTAPGPGAPSTRQAVGPSPSKLASQAQPPRPPPQLASASHVATFLDWAGASRADEKEAARNAIVAAAGNKEVIQAVIAEVERVQTSDPTRALLALAVLGETRSPVAQSFFTDFVWRPLPQRGTVIEGEIIEQTQAAQLQGKTADGLAYINSESSNKVIAQVIAGHPSKIVRAEAINAYLWNHGDSAEARKTLAPFVRKDELILLDRVRREPGESAATFDSKLEQFLAQHPEVVPPAPEKLQTAPKPADPAGGFDGKPPAF